MTASAPSEHPSGTEPESATRRVSTSRLWTEATVAQVSSAREPKQIWEVPNGQHVAGLTTAPAEYERRVVAFFDRTPGVQRGREGNP